MSAVDIKFYEKKKSQAFYAVLILLFIVIFLTIWLYYYSHTLEKSLEENQTTLAQLETSISDIQQDEKIQIYSIYKQNENVFRKLSNASKIPSMISHLKRVFAIQEVNYNGFSYNNEKVQMDLSLETNDSSYAYEKVTKFLNNYRANEEALFTIDQVSSFSWYDRMNFTVELTLKNQ